MKIGILSLQGCVKPHVPHLESLGCKVVEVKKASQLKEVEALLLPGGESSVFLKLIELFKLEKPLLEFFQNPSKKIWGICAGAILLAKEVCHPQQKSFSLLPIRAERNSYGSQRESFQTEIHEYLVSFIRAPRFFIIDSPPLSSSLRVEATFKESPVWVTFENRLMITAFHPELNTLYPSPFHRFFVKSLGSSLSSSQGGLP